MNPHSGRKSDFVGIPQQYPLLKKLSPRLIKCKAGDLVVWDSRCIHCNTPAQTDVRKTTKSTNSFGLLRLVTYICMSPASMFVPNTDDCETLEDFRRKREEFVRQRITCTHWPLELVGCRTFLALRKSNFFINPALSSFSWRPWGRKKHHWHSMPINTLWSWANTSSTPMEKRDVIFWILRIYLCKWISD